MTIKGSLEMSIPIVKALLLGNFLVKIGQKFAFFCGKCGRNVKCCFRDPKSKFLLETTSFDVLIVKIGAGALAVEKTSPFPEKIN